MDNSTISTASSLLFDQATATDPGTAVLKKALDMQAKNAATLINSLSEKNTAANLPPHLGQTINTTA